MSQFSSFDEQVNSASSIKPVACFPLDDCSTVLILEEVALLLVSCTSQNSEMYDLLIGCIYTPAVFLLN